MRLALAAALLVAPVGARDLSDYCPAAIRTADFAVPYTDFRAFHNEFSLEYCMVETTDYDPNTDDYTVASSPAALNSDGGCTRGTLTVRAGFEDGGGLTTDEKYLCQVSTFELMPNKCTYMAVSTTTHGATEDRARYVLPNDLDLSNYFIHDADNNVATSNWHVYTLSLTAAEYTSLTTADNLPFEYVQPIMHDLKVSPMLAAVEAHATVRVHANGDVTALALKAAVEAFIAANPSLCADCTVKVSEDFATSSTSINEVIVEGGSDAAAFTAALTLDHDATGLITDITADLPLKNYNTEANWILQSGNRTNSHTPFWDRNIKGQGIVAGVGDSGLDHQSCFFFDDKKAVTFPTSGFDDITGKPVWEDTSHRKVVQYVAYADPTEGENGGHGTHVSGTVAGSSNNLADDNGMAPEAKLAFYDIGMPNAQNLNVPGNLATQMFPYAKRVGVLLHSNSWGSTANTYSGNSRQIDEYSYENQDFLVLVAAGNSGQDRNTGDQVSGSLGSPATAKNCVAIGATSNGDEDNDLAYFSSRGPAYDGRIKPDVVAPGFSVTSANSITGPTDGHCSTTGMAGTSMATPATTGTIALGQQYFEDGFYPSGKKKSSDGFKPMGALLKAVLINSAQKLDGTQYANWQNSGNNAGPHTNWPNHDQGHGIVELDYTLNFNDAFKEQGLFVRGDFGDMPIFNSTDDPEVVHKFTSTGTDCIGGDANPKQFRATLAWHDPPGPYGTAKSLINDLDIVVEGSDGTTYHPNGRNERDNTNNAESVAFIPTKGVKYTVKISANTVAPKLPQPYAYVVSGCFASPDGLTEGSGAFPTATVLAVVGGLAGLALMAGLVVVGMKMFAGGRRNQYKPKVAKARGVATKRPSRAGGGSFTSALGLSSGSGHNGSASKSNANRPAGISLGGMNRKPSNAGSNKTKFHGKSGHGKVTGTFNSKKWNDLV